MKQNVSTSSSKIPGSNNIKGILLNVAFLIVAIIGLGILLLAVVIYFDNNIQKKDFNTTFDAIVMPIDFKLMNSQFGHNGSEGSLSLDRRYMVHGTREEIENELEPVLDKSGFNFTQAKKDLGINSDVYYAANIKENMLMTIQLLPLDSQDLVFRPGSNKKQVNVVDLELTY